MTSTYLYRAPKNSQAWTALACAVAVHGLAISLSWSVPGSPPNFLPAAEPGPTVTAEILPETAVQPVEPTPIEQPADLKPDQDSLPEPTVAPVAVRPTIRRPIPRFAKSTATGSTGGSARAQEMYAPRPPYPYEARKNRTTGTGVVTLVVSFSTGNVIEARMSQSTGSAVLDSSAVSALRTWRFRPGTVSNVDVPITYTLTGVSY